MKELEFMSLLAGRLETLLDEVLSQEKIAWDYPHMISLCERALSLGLITNP